MPNRDKSGQSMVKVDEVAMNEGVPSREPRKGKTRSPRTQQIHTWVRPYVKERLLAESLRRGVHQGVLLEEAWNLYEKQNPVG